MARSDRVVRFCARILPREFRERVFEPAWADTLLDERDGRTAGAARRARLILLFECFRLGMPRHVWHRGRPTRTARWSAAAVAGLTALRLVLALVYGGYGGR